MSVTRRRFLHVASTSVGLTGFGWTLGAQDVGGQAPALPGAPGVDLLFQDTALPDYSHDLVRHLERLVSEARMRRQQIIRGLTTREQVLARQKDVVGQLWTLLGGPFDRTPLHPRVTGVVQRSGYRIEKICFESRPQLFVTANLYLPDRQGRRPAILGPLGHSTTGKAWPTYQRLFSNLARKGYVVLAYDPFGQGERIEYPGARPGLTALGAGGTTEHEYAGRRLILLGANFSLFRTWDGIRGIDYLLTRPEVDPDRIGCCGQSGGGTLTQFLAALDNRIRVAVVSQGNTENVAQDAADPPGSADDAEQNIVPGLAHGLDRADLLYAFAPKPLLMTVTLHDAGHTYSPQYVASGMDMLEEYKRVYELFGVPDRVALQASTQAHGYVYEMRRATYGWFNRWFEVGDADDTETSQAVESDETLFVTPTGFVTSSFGGETALSLTRQAADRVVAPPSSGAADLQRRVRDVLAITEPRDERVPYRVLARIRKAGYRAEQFELTSDSEIRTPGWLLTPDGAGPATPTLLYIGASSAWSAVSEGAFPERLCAEARCRVAAIDVRGRGDCAIAYPSRGRFYFPNRITNEGYLTWFTLILGRPILGGQVHDALQALRYLRSRADLADGPISIMGDGPHGVIALYAALLDEQVATLTMRQVVTDYRSLAVAERYTQPFGIYAYGLLKQFDLPQLAGALAPRRALLLNPTGALGEPGGLAARERYGAATNVQVRELTAMDDPVVVVGRWVRE